MSTALTHPALAAGGLVIGVCTYRRASIAATLRSLGQLAPCGLPVQILVADNDAAACARDLVAGIAREHPLPVTYLHAPEANISVARNAILDAARQARSRYLVFIDDDECAAPDWLQRLLETAQASGAGAVLGPVLADFPASAPDWVGRAGLHDVTPVRDRAGHIATAHAGNVLLSLDDPAYAGLRFDIARGRSGGEDTAFFAAFVHAGGEIAYAADAVVREAVPAERLTLGWLMRRRFRMGQTHADQLRRDRSRAARMAQAGIAASKAAACLGMAALRAGDVAQRNRQLARSALHIGVVAKLAGIKDLQLYGAAPRVADGGNDASA